MLSKQTVCILSSHHVSAILLGPGAPWTNNTVSTIKELRVCKATEVWEQFQVAPGDKQQQGMYRLLKEDREMCLSQEEVWGEARDNFTEEV